MKIGVIGGGSWGTALASQSSIALGSCSLYVRNPDIVKQINSRNINSKYLPNILLPKTLKATNNLDEIFDNNIIIIAVPSTILKSLIESNYKKIKRDQILIIATKGLDNENYDFFSTFLKNKLPDNDICFLAGPNFASEVASGKFSIASIASENFYIAKKMSSLLSTETFIYYPSSDIIHLQISSCLKNIIAIVIGISQAIGNGDNFRAFLIAQGSNEIRELSHVLGALNGDFIDVASIGDLILTCTSMHSRNTNFGFQLAKTEYPKRFFEKFPNLVEGKEAVNVIYEIIKKNNLHLPIISNTHQLLLKLKSIENIPSKELNQIYKEFFSKIAFEAMKK